MKAVIYAYPVLPDFQRLFPDDAACARYLDARPGLRAAIEAAKGGGELHTVVVKHATTIARICRTRAASGVQH
jgi:hypothetical protein